MVGVDLHQVDEVDQPSGCLEGMRLSSPGFQSLEILGNIGNER